MDPAEGNGGKEAAAVAARRDSWHGLARFTPARIAMGRAGGSQRTEAALDFRFSHARARDAVWRNFHPEELAARFRLSGLETRLLSTAATSRSSYLMRPDLGRTLGPESRLSLAADAAGWGARDLAVIVSDGLSALAAERHALAVLEFLTPQLLSTGWTLFPVFIVPFGRVKLQDEVGEILGARHALMLLGERPGLGSPDSLGAYFTYQPRSSRTDADRNCVSNIRSGGISPADAARKLEQLLNDSRRLCLGGISLKDTGAPGGLWANPTLNPGRARSYFTA
jgi:ethanolamine ammonia-lyase small subunit